MTETTQDYFVHSSAHVDEGAVIGSGSKIWHFSHLMPGAVIGSQCIIGQNVFIAPGVVVGNGCKIQNNVSLYTGLFVAENVFIGPSVVFTNVTRPRAFIEQKDNFAPTKVEYGATIGANATIVCGHTIGKFAMVGAGSLVTKDVADYSLVYGHPAVFQAWICQCGHTLTEVFKDSFQCPHCKRSYKLEEECLKPIL